ncbi:hypothetical protein HK102_009940, partial [Quaeritorhiza haematococci]
LQRMAQHAQRLQAQQQYLQQNLQQRPQNQLVTQQQVATWSHYQGAQAQQQAASHRAMANTLPPQQIALAPSANPAPQRSAMAANLQQNSAQQTSAQQPAVTGPEAHQPPTANQPPPVARAAQQPTVKGPETQPPATATQPPPATQQPIVQQAQPQPAIQVPDLHRQFQSLLDSPEGKSYVDQYVARKVAEAATQQPAPELLIETYHSTVGKPIRDEYVAIKLEQERFIQDKAQLNKIIQRLDKEMTEDIQDKMIYRLACAQEVAKIEQGLSDSNRKLGISVRKLTKLATTLSTGTPGSSKASSTSSSFSISPSVLPSSATPSSSAFTLPSFSSDHQSHSAVLLFGLHRKFKVSDNQLYTHTSHYPIKCNLSIPDQELEGFFEDYVAAFEQVHISEHITPNLRFPLFLEVNINFDEIQRRGSACDQVVETFNNLAEDFSACLEKLFDIDTVEMVLCCKDGLSWRIYFPNIIVDTLMARKVAGLLEQKIGAFGTLEGMHSTSICMLGSWAYDGIKKPDRYDAVFPNCPWSQYYLVATIDKEDWSIEMTSLTIEQLRQTSLLANKNKPLAQLSPEGEKEFGAKRARVSNDEQAPLSPSSSASSNSPSSDADTSSS